VHRFLLRGLETTLRGPGIPRVGQEKASAVLTRQVGCRLLWHPRRKTFCVARMRGRMSAPLFYPVEFGNEMFPITDWAARLACDAVRLADAFAEQDQKKAMEVFLRRGREIARRETADFVAERFPDFMRDMHRAYSFAVNGTRAARPVFADLGSSPKRLRAGPRAGVVES